MGYYEVGILAPPLSVSPSEDLPECVAIGLGSTAFPLSGRQPGWDYHSFGYHSDDGRFFHGSGTRSHSFGPRFGVGDVVGCGMSLSTRQIFFTLNGRFLGIAFTARPSQLPLYPVVGLDSYAGAHFNFGQRPFCFDLATLPPSLTARPRPGAWEARRRDMGLTYPATAALRTLAAVFGQVTRGA